MRVGLCCNRSNIKILNPFVVLILHDSYLGATAALLWGVAPPSAPAFCTNALWNKASQGCNRLAPNSLPLNTDVENQTLSSLTANDTIRLNILFYLSMNHSQVVMETYMGAFDTSIWLFHS